MLNLGEIEVLVNKGIESIWYNLQFKHQVRPFAVDERGQVDDVHILPS